MIRGKISPGSSFRQLSLNIGKPVGADVAHGYCVSAAREKLLRLVGFRKIALEPADRENHASSSIHAVWRDGPGRVGTPRFQTVYLRLANPPNS